VRQSIEKASGVTTLWHRRHHLAGATLWHRPPHLAGAAWQIKTSIPEIERILQAVGTKFVRDDVDHEALAAELRRAFRQYVTRQELERDDATERQTRTEIESIVSPAKRLHETLQSGDRAARLLSEAMERKTQGSARGVWDPSDDRAWSLGRLQQGLAVCLSAATELLEREENLALAWRMPGEPTANYWLMGKLSEIYTNFVGREPFGVARSEDGVPGGPGIRFVQEALEIAGIKNRDGKPYRGEAIEKAWRQRSQGT
jgi:hypothetical protein